MKAIIPAAGLGTRFLPGTKCTPKEMLPGPGKPELLNYFQPDRSLENLLRERGKYAYADAVAAAGDMPVDFRYQYEPRGLGHAIRCAADACAGEPFPRPAGRLCGSRQDICDKMLEVSRAHAGASVIAVAPCAPEDVSRYGVIAGDFVGTLGAARGAGRPSPAPFGALAAWSRSPLPRRLRPTCTSSVATC